MNKKTFRIALIAAAVLTLTACSSTYKNSTSSSSTAKETVKDQLRNPVSFDRQNL